MGTGVKCVPDVRDVAEQFLFSHFVMNGTNFELGIVLLRA